MELKSLHCQRFRLLTDAGLRPGPRLTVIRGGNAQGKTSVLEAILFLATARSYRASSEEELAQRGADSFRIEGEFTRAERRIELEVNWWRGAKRVKINGVSQTRVSEVLGQVNVVFFGAGDLELAGGAAAVRRRFLDMELSQLSALYLRALQRYRTALRQRNELLKAREPDPAMLDAWDEQLARYGRALRDERAGFIERLSAEAATAYRRIAGEEELAIRYAPDVAMERDLADALAACRKGDMRRGLTSRGPHRDDMELRVGGMAAREYASQGQQRSVALAMKLAETELIREVTGEYPLLLLDDVLSELDAARSKRVLGVAREAQMQCIVTTTDLTVDEAVFGRGCAFYKMEGGRLAGEGA